MTRGRKPPACYDDRIHFHQQDLLAFNAAPDFAIVACSGVLHHLADPLLGWRRLIAALSPLGVMKIGLYSRLARKELGLQLLGFQLTHPVMTRFAAMHGADALRDLSAWDHFEQANSDTFSGMYQFWCCHAAETQDILQP